MNFSDVFGPDGISENAIILTAALAAFVNVFLIYRVMLVRDPNATRIKQLHQRMYDLKRDALKPRRRARHQRSLGFMRNIVGRFNLLRTKQASKAALALSRAGWRSRDALNIYFFLKLCLPFVFGIAAVIALYVVELGTFDTTTRAIIALGAVVVGAYSPDIFVNNAATKRKKEIIKGLPDALDLMVICAEAGQSLDAALARIAAEMNSSCPEIADEIRLTALELGLLPERRQALDNLNARTNTPGIRGVVNTLNQTEKYGTPLAQSLRVLAAEFRNDRMMKAETKAAKLPAIMTVPMIIFILPPLFIVLIGPAILSVMDSFLIK